jgi:hypothetical protein
VFDDFIWLELPDGMTVTLSVTCGDQMKPTDVTEGSKNLYLYARQEAAKEAVTNVCKCGVSEKYLDPATDTCKDCPANSFAQHSDDGTCMTRCKCRSDYYEYPLPAANATQLMLGEDNKPYSSYPAAERETGFGCRRCPAGGICDWEVNGAPADKRGAKEVTMKNGHWQVKEWFGEPPLPSLESLRFETCFESAKCALCQESYTVPKGQKEKLGVACADVCKCPGRLLGTKAAPVSEMEVVGWAAGENYALTGPDNNCREGHVGALCSQVPKLPYACMTVAWGTEMKHIHAARAGGRSV